MNAAGIATVDSGAATDTELVAAVRVGDERAFEELYRRHQPAVAVFVRRRLRDAVSAEDVTQEAFTSALRRMRRTDARIVFRPWIYAIARNASIDHHRRHSRVRELSLDVTPTLAAADSARLLEGSLPDARVLGRERFEHLRGALEELSSTHSRAIVLRELEGLSYHEIGERMQLSASAVESTLFRARRRLKHEYAELDSGRRCRMVNAAIARLADGCGSERDRRRLARHARRCAGCRRQARSCGVEPLDRGGSRMAAVALLPAFLRERLTGGASGSVGSGAGLGPFVPAGAELPATFAGKAVAVIATAMMVGGGGATLGGVGPLAPEGGQVGPGAAERAPAQTRSDGHPDRERPVGRALASRVGARGASERSLAAALAAGAADRLEAARPDAPTPGTAQGEEVPHAAAPGEAAARAGASRLGRVPPSAAPEASDAIAPVVRPSLEVRGTVAVEASLDPPPGRAPVELSPSPASDPLNAASAALPLRASAGPSSASDPEAGASAAGARPSELAAPPAD